MLYINDEFINYENKKMKTDKDRTPNFNKRIISIIKKIFIDIDNLLIIYS